MLPTLEIDPEVRAERLEHKKRFEIPAGRFKFLNEHSGLRNGKVHILLSTSGAGKSTLTRSILHDTATFGPVLFYSSEENLVETQEEFAVRQVPNSVLKNITMIHESELDTKLGEDELFRVLEVSILNSGATCLFFDNLTTSDFYEGLAPQKQVAFFARLKKLAIQMDIPFFLIAHTTSTVRDDQQSLIRAEDILGSKSPARKSEFVYIYQRIIGSSSPSGLTTPMFGILRVLKARGYETHQIYLLTYDFEKREYLGDKKLSNSEFKEIYGSRFKL